MGPAAEHISRKSISRQLNRPIWLYKLWVQTIGRTKLKIFIEEEVDIEIKYKYINHMNIEIMKIIVAVDK